MDSPFCDSDSNVTPPHTHPPQAASDQSQTPPTKAVLETAIGPHAPSLYRQRGPVKKVPPEVVIRGCDAVDAAAVAAYEHHGYVNVRAPDSQLVSCLRAPDSRRSGHASPGTCALGSAA